MDKQVDHQYTNNITCPYCGYEDKDSWKEDDDGELECGRCSKEFTFNRNVTVTYCTEKKEQSPKEAKEGG